jgi:glycosyltransferase involved in cell wall biosynthesis
MSVDVSVIIPFYNQLDSLSCAIACLKNQTFCDFKIIIVDDGSDEDISYIRDFDPRIILIRHNHNRGAAAARNTGVIAAKEKYVAFMDSDDEWFPRKLEIQVEWMNKFSPIKASTTGYYLRSSEGSYEKIIKNQTNWYRYFMRGIEISPGTTLMVERNIMLKYLYDEKLQRLEDWDWALRFSEENEIYVIQKVLAKINKFSCPDAKSVEKANLKIIEKHKSAFRKEGYFYSQFCIGKRYLEIANHHYRENNLKQGWQYLFKTILTFPLQRPGMYLRIFDYIYGTNVIVKLKKIWFKFLSNR